MHSDEMSVEDLATRVGMTVRTVRFYAGRGLIPPPRREGRNGYYGPEHVARLELVRELQAHGFTLSAIEGFLGHLPADASAQDIALQRTLLAPWSSDLTERLDRTVLEKRSGRALSDDDIELLVALSVIEPTPEEDVFSVTTAHLNIGIQMLELGLPVDAARAAQQIFTRHGQQIAEEITDVFRTMVWPTLRESDQPAEVVTAIIDRYKPVSVQALVVAYESAVNETKRETVRRRS